MLKVPLSIERDLQQSLLYACRLNMYDHILFLHKILLACELVHKRFYLVNVVKHVITFIHLDGEELGPYEQDVGQTFSLMFVARFVFHVSAGPLHPLMCTNS